MTLSGWDPLDPDELNDYELDWGPELRVHGDDSIVASTWVLDSDAQTAGVLAPATSFTDRKAIVWLTGGAVGTYTIENTITTAGGRTRQRTVSFTVAEA